MLNKQKANAANVDSTSNGRVVQSLVMVELRDFDIAEYLDDPETTAAYLEDALDDDPGEFLAALGDVARAKGMSALAKDAGVSRPALYRSLTVTAHPDFQTILRVLRGVGVDLRLAARASAPAEA